MPDTLLHNPVIDNREEPVAGWSTGVFAEAGTQLPAPCLRHCLAGESAAAQTHS